MFDIEDIELIEYSYISMDYNNDFHIYYYNKVNELTYVNNINGVWGNPSIVDFDNDE